MDSCCALLWLGSVGRGFGGCKRNEVENMRLEGGDEISCFGDRQ